MEVDKVLVGLLGCQGPPSEDNVERPDKLGR